MHHRKYLIYLFLFTFLFANFIPVGTANGQSSETRGAYPQPQGKAALLMDASSGRVVFQLNAHQHLSPASVTKIMTALLLIENGDLDRKVTISETAAATPESSIWLEAGEKLTRRQLLYACMLNSANDAAVALAESMAGSEKNFVELMNRRARELGMKDTHFCNPHGLETKGHYTTAYDLALVSREAMNYKVFRQVVSTRTRHIPWAGNDYDRLLINQNRLLYRYDSAIGIKTGYTKQAGNCVVGAAQKGSLLLIAVAMNSPSVYQDLEQMLDYGFTHYKKVTIKKSRQLSMTVPVTNGLGETVKVRPKTDLTVAVASGEKNRLAYKLFPASSVAAPVKKGQTAGYCKIYVAGREAGKVDLVTCTSVAKKLPFSIRFKSGCINVVKFIGKALLILFGLAYLIRFVNLRRQRKRRRR